MTVSTESSSPTTSQRSYLTEPLLPPEDPLLITYDDEEFSEASTVNLVSNVRRILALTWFSFTGRSIWSQSVLSIFVYLLNKDNPERVGYVTAVMGMSQVVSSLPAECLKWQRNNILRLGSLVGAIAAGLTVVAILNWNFYWLIGAMSLWGVMWGITDAALPSLFADSIPEEHESIYYTRGSRVIRSSNFLGPLIALGVFLYLGNEWTLVNCSIVMSIGLAFFLPVILMLCCLRESHTYLDFNPPDEIHVQGQEEDCKLGLANNDVLVYHPCSDDREVSALDSTDESSTGSSRPCCSCWQQKVIVPTLITCSDILSGVASGMSIRYFPVFFVSNLGLTPVQVQILYMVAPLFQAVFKCFARGLAKVLGASFVSVLFHWAFVTLLGGMLYCYLQGMSMWVVCGLYIAHASLMNSTCALSRSIMLSTIPEEEVHKWTIAQRIQLFLWSGGAALGGILVGHQGIVFNFYATAALQLVATLPLVLLCCMGPSKDDVNEFLFPALTDDEENNLSSLPREENESDEPLFEESRDFVDSDPEFFDCSPLCSSEDKPVLFGSASMRVKPGGVC
jgi:hypothetical protein